MSKNIDFDITKYIESGKYFEDARQWYNIKYLAPITHRSIIISMIFIFLSILLCMIINIYMLFPIDYRISYIIFSPDSLNQRGKIIKSNFISENSLLPIISILVENYVLQREKYSYDNLKRQFSFIENTSTRLVYKQFINYMSLNNENSPVLRYQKELNRTISIQNFYFDKQEENMFVKFISIASDVNGKIVEKLFWLAEVSFDVGGVEDNKILDGQTNFKFKVTNYKLKLLEN